MWLGRFVEPLPIRCRGAFHLYSAGLAETRQLIVVAADPLAGTEAERSLERLVVAHRVLADVPGIAPVAELAHWDGRPYARFALDVVDDGEGLLARLVESRQRASHEEGLTAIDVLSAALVAAHERGLCLGRIGWGNLLVTATGELGWLGFGHNVCVVDEADYPTGSAFVAPEVAAGSAPTPASDVYAFYLLQHALLPFVALPDAVQAAFAGRRDTDEERELGGLLHWIATRVLGAHPAERATLVDARAQAAYERTRFGLTLCPAELRARLVALYAAGLGAAAGTRPSASAFTVAVDGAWLELPSGERFVLDRRPARRVLTALVRRRKQAPGEFLDADALLAAGWPGERPLYEAGRNRVYATMSGLRALGLRELLQRDPSGYRLDPAVPLEVVDG